MFLLDLFPSSMLRLLSNDIGGAAWHSSVDQQFLASIDLSRLEGMRRKTKKKWLTHLAKAEAAHRIELKARKKGQHTMWSYLGMADPSKEGIT